MKFHYVNLDARTREYMMKELDGDIDSKVIYLSSRLNEEGLAKWPAILKEAVKQYDDAWLAEQLRMQNLLKTHEEKNKPKGGTTVAKVPVTAPDTLSEGEFNRIYARGLCARAVEEGIPEVEVYRGKEVAHPRSESQGMIGKKVNANALLEDLRKSNGVEPALGLPPGPNSGLTIKIV